MNNLRRCNAYVVWADNDSFVAQAHDPMIYGKGNLCLRDDQTDRPWTETGEFAPMLRAAFSVEGLIVYHNTRKALLVVCSGGVMQVHDPK